MTQFPARPPGEYSADHNGLGDPLRPSAADRLRMSEARLAEERADSASLSPTIRRLRAVAAKALGGAS
jgi:hypothetical protein